jgi:predicted TIM-barrel fold metal-dependent hydrolase
MLQAMDYQAAENNANLRMRPSEYFRRQIYACFWFESGSDLIQDIERIGTDNCLFETDFPHPTCLFPEPLRYVASALEGADDNFRRKVLSTNAAAVYNFDVTE